MSFVARTKRARNLDELLVLLNRYDRKFDLSKYSATLSELPVFSEDEPEVLTGIFSYDDTRRIVASGGSYVIEARDDL